MAALDGFSPDGLPDLPDLAGVLANRLANYLPEQDRLELSDYPDQAVEGRPHQYLLTESMHRTAGQAPPVSLAAPNETGYYFLEQAPLAPPGLDPLGIRDQLPALHQKIHGRPLVWLDNAATTQKPQVVIDGLKGFYERDNSNVHRGAHALAGRATDLYEGARQTVQRFLKASSSEEIVWVRGTTEGINLVAQTFGIQALERGDEVLLSTMEHHSNIVPWQMVSERQGARLRVIPITDDGSLDLAAYARLLNPRTRIVAITHVSNVLGTVVPLEPVIEMAHSVGARVLVDGAQAVQHMPVDVQALDADFYVFSGHKLFGPTGIGALYGKRALLEQMPPWQGGGSMIDQVFFDHTTYASVPAKFEAGTGHIAGAVGLGVAIDWLEGIGLEKVAAHEEQLLTRGVALLAAVPGLRLIGTAPGKVSNLTFVMEGVESERVGAFLNSWGIAVRAGHHCAQPALRRYGLESAVRASLALYNTGDEIDYLAEAVTAGLRRGWE